MRGSEAGYFVSFACNMHCAALQSFPHLLHHISERWAVHATMNPVFCNAIVDFNVPGKLKPPPVKLSLTVWTQFQYLRTGTREKYAIEFTDPSGTLAAPSVPLNTWVQLENIVTKDDPVTIPKSCIEESPLVFKDQHDDDQKVVTLSGNNLTIGPFDESAENDTFVNLSLYTSLLSILAFHQLIFVSFGTPVLAFGRGIPLLVVRIFHIGGFCKFIAPYSSDRWIVDATMDPISCTAIVNFTVPNKKNPPPVNLTATVWTLQHKLPSGIHRKYAIEWTDPSGTLAAPSVPLNTWVQADAIITPRSCLEGSPMVFKDMHDDDSKKVALSDDDLSITPFGSDERLSIILCAIPGP